MTLAELTKRVAALEADLSAFRAEQAARDKPLSWLDTAGKYVDDPDYAEAMRLGREERERVNRESLEEFDREAAKAKPLKKMASRRKSDARA